MVSSSSAQAAPVIPSVPHRAWRPIALPGRYMLVLSASSASHRLPGRGRERRRDRRDSVPAPVRLRLDHLPAQLDAQGGEAHRQLCGSPGEPADPATRGRIRHSCRSRRPYPARPARHLPDHRTRHIGRVQPPGQRERRQQRMRHPAGTPPDPPDETLPLLLPLADVPPVTRPEHHRYQARRALRPRHLDRPPVPSPRTHRPSAGTAIPWTRRITAPDPFSRQDGTQARRDLYVKRQIHTILNRDGHSRSPHQ